MAPLIVAIEQSCPAHIDWKALVDEHIGADLIARGLTFSPEEQDLQDAQRASA
jgi:hypothetical protein